MKTIHIDGVGDVVMAHSRRAKHIVLSVKPFRGVQIAVPLRATFDQAEMVARSKVPWLKKHLNQMAVMEKKALAHQQRLAPATATAPAKAMARKTIIKRVQELAAAYNLIYAKVHVRNQKTRWGSCSLKNNISLNIQAAHLPPELMDYLILHELVHTRIRNHSEAFWRELATLIDRPREIDRQLNEYNFLLAL